MGLTSTLRSILGFLNLAELGIGTAIGFALYKPIFEKNYTEINKIIALLGILYKRIGFFILGTGIVVSLFFPYFFCGTEFSIAIIYFAFYSFLSSTLLSYFFNYHMTLLEADQKGYVVQVYFQSINVVRLILQALIAYYLESYYIWIFMELVFSSLMSIVLRVKVKEHYPWLIINSKENASLIKVYPEIIKKSKQLFVHKMGVFVKDGTDNILVYMLVNVQNVAFFGNYQLIFMNLSSFINIVFAGIGGGVGNMIAENDKKNIDKVFWEMMALQFFIAGFLSLATYYLINPFIILWVGESYVLGDFIIFLMISNFFIGIIRSPVQHFINGYGLFFDTWAPIVEIILNLIISIIFGKLWGISGIMFGTLVSLLIIVMLWRPYFLYKKGFKIAIWNYWKGFIPLLLVFMGSAFIINAIYNHFLNYADFGFLNWSFKAAILSVIIIVIYGSLMFVSSQGFRDFYYRILALIRNKLKKQ